MGRLDLLLDAHPGRLEQRLGLSPGLLHVLGVLLVDPVRLLREAFPGRLAVRPQPVGVDIRGRREIFQLTKPPFVDTSVKES